MSINTPLKDIVELSKESTSFRSIQEQLKRGARRIELSGLYGSSKSLFLSLIHQEMSCPLFVLVSNTEQAEMIRDDLEGFLGPGSICYYPARDVLLFEESPISAEVMGLRMETLAFLIDSKPIVVVSPVSAILEKVFPPETFKSRTINLKVGQRVSFDHLAPTLFELGFEREPIVEDVGQFSIRGGIVDLYSFASEKPIRLEFFDNTIESIRSFDIRTQRSIDHQQEVTILPCSDNSEDGGAKTPMEADTYSYSLLDYLPPESILFIDEPSLIRDKVKQIGEGQERQFSPVDDEELRDNLPNFLACFENIENQLDSFAALKHSLLPQHEKNVIDVGTKGQEPFNANFTLLRKGLARLRDAKYRIFVICDNTIQAERLEELEEDLGQYVRFAVGHLHNGFLLPDAKLAVYTDHEIFRRHRLPHRVPKYEEGTPIKDLGTIQHGDTVVHVDYGIGCFEGLRRITAQGKEQDCLSIMYQNNDKLYVPIDQLNRIQKYVGPEGAVAALSKLGSSQWERTKERTKKAIATMAADLIKTAALRKTRKGHAFSPTTEWQKELEAAFPYEETPDQLRAAEEVKQDMNDPAPMDRLICGDVGYGKTEVAIRAAFKAVMDHKQVALLVPTTILAQQHLKTFHDRLNNYPLRIEMLSRFRTKSEQKKIIEGLKKGTVDIVIGTHRLLQKDVQLKDIGLLVVDEEQRFGVSHKERLKRLMTSVDVLTLTATPIPRTLHMSLMGARDMSIINTAPKDRLPIQTKIVRFNEDLIRAAILREVGRGGQVYFVHNRVQSIRAISNLLTRIVPEVALGIAHGQMDERNLERVMVDFLDRKFDCLISTMIIEAGLDIPNVNTIIINRADRFGLAQLYQLRGRVGRSDKLAYAYLLVPPIRNLTEKARQRLQALEEFTELGSGFQLAMRDLEIRGAGNILGPQQHGFIAAIGFDLYCKLLADTVKELKGDSVPDTADPKIEINIDAYIPEEYIQDNEQKMIIYQRLAKMTMDHEIQEMEDELKDRFGDMPKPVKVLLEMITVKALAYQIGMKRVTHSDQTLSFEFTIANQEGRKKIETLVFKSPVPLEFEAEEALVAKAKVTCKSDEEVLGFTKNILLHLL